VVVRGAGRIVANSQNYMIGWIERNIFGWSVYTDRASRILRVTL
jgi:hypothetical protein